MKTLVNIVNRIHILYLYVTINMKPSGIEDAAKNPKKKGLLKKLFAKNNKPERKQDTITVT